MCSNSSICIYIYIIPIYSFTRLSKRKTTQQLQPTIPIKSHQPPATKSTHTLRRSKCSWRSEFHRSTKMRCNKQVAKTRQCTSSWRNWWKWVKLGGRLDFKQLLMVVYTIHYIFTSVLYIPGGAGFHPTESLQVLMSPDEFFVFVGSLLKKNNAMPKKWMGPKYWVD